MRASLGFGFLVASSFTISPLPLKAETSADLMKRYSDAVVKIVVSGTDLSQHPITEHGSGFIVSSSPTLSLVVTASHVIGTGNNWRTTPQCTTALNNCALDRAIKVDRLNEKGEVVHLSDATVIAQDDKRDLAVLAISANGLKCIPLDQTGAFNEPMQEVLLLGFKKGEWTLTPAQGTGKMAPSQTLGIGFLGNLTVFAGQSGGPILNRSNGKVIAVASYDQGVGDHVAAPVFQISPMLSGTAFTCGGPEIPIAEPIKVSGHASVSIRGASGAALRTGDTASAQLGDWAEVRKQGEERSECNPSDNRTVSGAGARGSVSQHLTGGVRFDYALNAQGGHFRTAATCAGPIAVGITGHDTDASSSVELVGSVTFKPKSNADAVRITWKDLPTTGARLALEGVPLTNEGGQTVKELTVSGSGSKSIKLPANIPYVAKLLIRQDLNANGACCPVEGKGTSYLFVEP